jgi:hypothetical protein
MPSARSTNSGREFNESHEFFVCTNYVNLMGVNKNTIKKNKEALLETSR